jgi:2-keto-4-pentenoate hydratase/2-oxohepta-3-ene-1,7-dioic acid hydratase in catechol pathway
MDQDRRDFLKRSGMAGTLAVAGGLTTAGPALAQAPSSSGAARTNGMARGMTFCSLRKGDGFGLGLRTERGILDVAVAERDFRERAPTTIDDVLQGRGELAGLARLVSRAGNGARAGRYWVAEADAPFGPCVPNPEKIICIGLNYRKHAAEAKQPVPTSPILFSKYRSALNHHGGAIAVSREAAQKFDYEAELVIVIGRTARNVSEADAKSYIFGYCTGNDFSARDLQMRTTQWMLGKANDGFGPIGPWLVTADQVDGDNLAIECRVNGELRQSSNTRDLIFGCAALVSYSSKHMTLQPGDIIFTGTPEGVIAGYPPEKQVWMKPGDRLATTIEKLGTLENTLT